MNIAIDTSPISNANKYRGVGSYTKNLIEALERYEKENTYSFFTRVQKVPENADLVHYPYFDPYFLTLPMRKPKPTIITVHDLIPMVFPDRFPSGFKGTLKWQMQKLSLSAAKRIITDSKSSKTDVSRIAGIDRARIDVVYLAPDPAFQPVKTTTLSNTRSKYGLENPYVLYVGDVNWNKNIPGLLQGFAKFCKQKAFSAYNLVLVGSAFTSTELPEMNEINVLINALGIAGRVIKTGRVSNEDLRSLYGGSTTLVQPSLYEGFGLPVLEAFACGCPVISSDVSSLSEIRGPSLGIDPTDPATIDYALMAMVQKSEKERKTMISQGFAWVKQFTWQKVARETVVSYERALQ